jgi:UDP-N-acetylmuramate dehydrogenase
LKIQKNISLSPLTSIKLGGKAKYFCKAKNIRDIKQAIVFAKKNCLKVHVLGNGSNTVFPDKNLKKLVIKICLKGISFIQKRKGVFATAAAGINWDKFVAACVKKNLCGLEALSGIPGTVGAAPVQNIGAYGQEISQTLFSLKALSLKTLKEVKFKNKDCLFSYRDSRFKNKDKNKFIILEVSFLLKNNRIPEISYPELKKELPFSFSLKDIRSAVLKIRKRKSMLFNPCDNNARSCGSFFVNPKISKKQLQTLKKSFSDIIFFPSENKIKVSAAWLIEKSEFKKGYFKNGVGISKHHALALINKNGSTKNLLALAEKIKTAVFKKFHLRLKIEPEIVKPV